MQVGGGGGAVDGEGEAVIHPPTPAPFESTDPNLAPPAADPDPAAPPARKRRLRKKKFPEMIPSHDLRVLRANTSSRSGSADGQPQLQIADAAFRPRRGRGRPPGSGSSQARELDSETLIAASVGFPVDSLTEEEIEANVVHRVGGPAQAKYIVVRNHIVSLWRSNPTAWVTEAHVMESIRSERRALVSAAYAFLLDHSHINFGLAPAILSRPLSPPIPASIVIIGAGLAGIATAHKLTNLGFKVVILEGRSG